ncbi:MAG: fumarate hydratase [Candidatus Bathyarchaeota archaeon]|nr:fumarate hydratase [Candidatus Bathyarchaeota archaeon]
MLRQDKVVEEVAFELVRQAVIFLPQDVKAALQRAYTEETSEVARTQLQTILDNVALAEKKKVPICQDTGNLVFFVKVGAEFEGIDCVENALLAAVRRATVEVPLRPNAVHPFTQKNSGDNTGRGLPEIHWELVSGKTLALSVLVKGGGSENFSVLGLLNPAEGLSALKRFVVDAVIRAGAQPCPPTILGVGVGGSAELALHLAKKALLKPLGEPNEDESLDCLEQELLEAANLTGIGPMGMGGRTTVLGVHLDYAFRHPASFPVAVMFNCWAARHASARIEVDGSVKYLTHTK